MKYLHFGLWPISYKCSQDNREMKLVDGVISLRSFWQKRKFILGDYEN